MKLRPYRYYIIAITIIYVIAVAYFVVQQNSRLVFTSEERNWIVLNAEKPFKILALEQNNTMVYKSGKTGLITGDVVNFANYLNEQYDMHIQVTTTSDSSYFQSAMNSHAYNMYFGVSNSLFYSNVYEFSAPFESNNLSLYAQSDAISSTSDMVNHKIAILNSYGISQKLKSFYPILQKYNFIYCQDLNAAKEMLKTNKIDGFITEIPLPNSLDYAKAFSFVPFTYQWSLYIPKDNTLFYRVMNKGLQQYLKSNQYENEHEVAIQDVRFNELSLTALETQYIRGIDTLKMGMYKTYAPYEDKSLFKGESGNNFDYLFELSEMLKVAIKPVYYQDFKVMLEDLENGKIDLIGSMPNYAYENRFSYTGPYTQYNNVIVGSAMKYQSYDNSLLNYKNIGINRRAQAPQNMINDIASARMILYDDIDEAVAMLNHGTIDFFIENKFVVNQYLNSTLFTSGKILGEESAPSVLSFVVNKQNHELLSILNKYIQVWPYNQHTYDNAEIIILETNMLYFALATVLFILLIIAFYMMTTTRKRTILRKTNEQQLNDSIEKNKMMVYALVEVFDEASTANDHETGTHVKRVTKYAVFIATQLGLSPELIDAINKYASLHDLGKIGVDEKILKKPGKFTPEEFTSMKAHVKIGSKLIFQLGLGDVCENIIRYHHEKWDGTGYLKGLKGEQIPIESRIVALADVYDALRMKRVYKKAFSHEETVEIIMSESGKHFDPKIVQLFLDNHQVLNQIYINSVEKGE